MVQYGGRENQLKALEALANIARQVNRILNQYDSGTSSEVENQLTTPTLSTTQTASRSANTNSSATLRSSGSSESVTQALLR